MPADGSQEFYLNNEMPFSTGDKASNADGSECAAGDDTHLG